MDELNSLSTEGGEVVRRMLLELSSHNYGYKGMVRVAIMIVLLGMD